MIRSGNPALSARTFSELSQQGLTSQGNTMTLEGTVQKCFLLFGCLMLSAVPTWWLFFNGHTGLAGLLAIGGAIAGLVLALITAFKKTAAPITAPLYALAEGAALGGISALFESTAYSGIVMQATMLTMGIFLALLLAYRSGLIQPTENFKLGLFAATGGIFMVYMASMVMRMFGMNMPYLHDSGTIGIGISVFIVIIAALNLVLDFDFIEQGSAQGAPKYMEWYGAFGLMVTLVWLYMEVLNLLRKLNDRR